MKLQINVPVSGLDLAGLLQGEEGLFLCQNRGQDYIAVAKAGHSVTFCFQAEDGIRVGHVTGVQTCALPILVISAWFGLLFVPPAMAVVALLTLPWIGVEVSINQPAYSVAQFFADSFQRRVGTPLPKIGRASCREIVEVVAVGVSLVRQMLLR